MTAGACGRTICIWKQHSGAGVMGSSLLWSLPLFITVTWPAVGGGHLVSVPQHCSKERGSWSSNMLGVLYVASYLSIQWEMTVVKLLFHSKKYQLSSRNENETTVKTVLLKLTDCTAQIIWSWNWNLQICLCSIWTLWSLGENISLFFSLCSSYFILLHKQHHTMYLRQMCPLHNLVETPYHTDQPQLRQAF